MESKRSECGPCEGGMAMLCGGGNCGGHYGLVLLRWFFGIIILLMVFCLGVKVGFYKGIIESAGYSDEGYGFGGMMGSYRHGRPMMYLSEPVSLPTTATPAPKTK